MPRSLLLPALAALLATGPVRADCELLYAPPEIRARLLAFHHANELRRARERTHGSVARSIHQPMPDAGPARDHAVPPTPPARSR